MGTPPCISGCHFYKWGTAAISTKGNNFIDFHIVFLYRKILKKKHFASKGANAFLKELTPFGKVGINQNCRDAST